MASHGRGNGPRLEADAPVRKFAAGPKPVAGIGSGPGQRDGEITAAPDRLLAARAMALFVSDLSSARHPGKAAVAAAISDAVRAHGGVRGCAGEVGGAYGEHPETAAARMRWARHVIGSPWRSGIGLMIHA
jgi:hypothetical protein